MTVKSVGTVGWTQQSVAASLTRAMTDYRKAAGERVLRYRQAKGWSQEDLAHQAGLSSKTVSRFEKGKHEGRRDTVQALAEAFGVNEIDIMGLPPSPLGLEVHEVTGDETQLDRIEALLIEVLSRLPDAADTDPAKSPTPTHAPPGPPKRPARRTTRAA